jgi:hypothetical protein
LTRSLVHRDYWPIPSDTAGSYIEPVARFNHNMNR